MNLRPILPMPALLTGVVPSRELGARPELRWVAPASLLVDERYQRDLGKRSIRLISNLLAGFAWRKMKPPIVVDVDNALHCVDGQHTAIAAATLGVPEIPVFVVDGATKEARAAAFVAHNNDRIVMTALDIYRARLAAGDEDALTVDKVCERAGVRMRQTNQFGRILPGDTQCVGTIQRLVKRRGAMKARMVLQSLVRAGIAPIGPAELDAVESIICMVRPNTTVEAMAKAVTALGRQGLLEARMRSTAERRPQKHIVRDRLVDLLRRQAGGVHARAS